MDFSLPTLFQSPGRAAAMVKRSSLASRLPAQKAKPRGEVAQFPILENEEGSEATYRNPPLPQTPPLPLLVSIDQKTSCEALAAAPPAGPPLLEKSQREGERALVQPLLC